MVGNEEKEIVILFRRMERRNKEEGVRRQVQSAFIYPSYSPIFLPYPHRPPPSIIRFSLAVHQSSHARAEKIDTSVQPSITMKWSIISLHKRLIMSVTRVTGRFFLPSFAPRSHSPPFLLPSSLTLFKMISSTQHPKASSSRR